MFEVRLYNGPQDVTGTVIHHPINKGYKITGSIKQAINEIESFDFVTYLENPAYKMTRPLKTLVDVYNTKTKNYEFEGRVLTLEEETDENGTPSKSVVCESELGYFHDSVQVHNEFRGTPKQLIETILSVHNDQVEEYKQFELGRMDVTNSTNNMYVYLSDDKTTYEELFDKLIDRLGGEFLIRKENGVRYLDYINRIGEDVDTEIRLSKNLMSVSKDVDATEIITRLIPLGKRIESEDESATDASQARLTIESVNNGCRYLDRQDLITEFGIRAKPVVWDDVNLPDRLMSTGNNFLNEQKLVLNQYQLDALDLSLIDIDYYSLEVGNGYPTINPIMSIDEVLRIVKKDININQPEGSTYTIGDKFKTLSEYQRESNRNTARVAELQEKVNRQAEIIGDLNTTVSNVNDVVNAVNIKVGEADLPGLNQTIVDLNNAIVNLNDVVESIPSYGLATPTYSGLMPLNDKAKLDLISLTKEINLDIIDDDITEYKGNIATLTTAIEDLTLRVEALEPTDPPSQTGQ